MAQRKGTLSREKPVERREIATSRPLTRVSTPKEVSLLLKSTKRHPSTSRKSPDLGRASIQCSFHPTHIKSNSAFHSPSASSQSFTARIQALERSNATLTAQLYAEKAKNGELEAVLKECMEKLAETLGACGHLDTSRAQEGRKSVNLKIKPTDRPPGREMCVDICPGDSPSHPILLLTKSLGLQLHTLFLSLQHLSLFISRLTQLIHATKTGSLPRLLRLGMSETKEKEISSVEEGRSQVERARRELGVIEAQLIDWYADFTAHKCAIS